MLNKKADIGVGVIVLVTVLLTFIAFFATLGQRECRGNKDCGSESYCGSDFSCHPYPSIQKTVVQYNLMVPSVIIGIAIVIGAIILNRNKGSAKEESRQSLEQQIEIKAKEPEEVEDIREPYYKSGTNTRTP